MKFISNSHLNKLARLENIPLIINPSDIRCIGRSPINSKDYRYYIYFKDGSSLEISEEDFGKLMEEVKNTIND